MSEKLKKCPFCGGTCKMQNMSNGPKPLWGIQCDECRFTTHLYGNKESLLEMWNTRPAEDTLLADLRRLAEMWVVNGLMSSCNDELEFVKLTKDAHFEIEQILSKYRKEAYDA